MPVILRRLSAIKMLAVGLFLILPWGFMPVAPMQAQTIPPAATPFDMDAIPAELRVSDGEYYKPGEVLVSLVDAAHVPGLTMRALDISAVQPLDVRGSDHTLRSSAAAGQPTGYILTVPVGQEWTTIAQLSRDPNVLFAQPNWVIEATQSAVPETPFAINDPFYRADQWYLQRILYSRAWPVVDANADRSERVRVAVVDSGVDPSHPDLGGRVRPIKSYVTGSNGELVTVDDFGHGTHIAGLIGATLNNNLGIAGVEPEVVLDPYKVLDSRGVGFISDAADAIRDASDNGADIINMSFAISASAINDPDNAYQDFLLHSAIYYAQDQDVLLVAAAGNRYPEAVAFPAAYPEVMAVAATDEENEWATYSNAGSEVDLAAPGGTPGLPLASTWPTGLPCNSTVGGAQGYCERYGTSFATGLVSGVAAQLLAINPDYSANDLRTLLVGTAAPSDQEAIKVGAGLLDAETAVRTALAPVAALQGGDVGLVAPQFGQPLTYPVLIENESATSASWQLTRPDDAPWLIFAGVPAATKTFFGNATYDRPAQVDLIASPGALPPGIYTARMTFVSGTGADAQSRTFEVRMAITDAAPRVFLPLVGLNATPDVAPKAARIAYEWATPNNAGKTNIDLSGNQSVAIGLPFGFPLGGQSYASARVHADGFMTFPSTDVETGVIRHCLPSTAWPNQAVYGWWADLEPGAALASISTFRTATGDFVVEYVNVPLAAGPVGETATFQIVLATDGEIKLNYQRVPTSANATVGVEALGGRLYNLLYCSAGGTRFGLPPVDNQSFAIGPEGVF